MLNVHLSGLYRGVLGLMSIYLGWKEGTRSRWVYISPGWSCIRLNVHIFGSDGGVPELNWHVSRLDGGLLGLNRHTSGLNEG